MAGTGLATGAANPAAATSGLSQDMAALSMGAPATSTTLHSCLVPGCLFQGLGAADLDGRQMDKASGTMLTLTSTPRPATRDLDE